MHGMKSIKIEQTKSGEFFPLGSRIESCPGHLGLSILVRMVCEACKSALASSLLCHATKILRGTNSPHLKDSINYLKFSVGHGTVKRPIKASSFILSKAEGCLMPLSYSLRHLATSISWRGICIWKER